jgi:cytochrome c oxidase cbb3-type subunit 2
VCTTPQELERFVDGGEVQAMMKALRRVGVPFADADIDAAPAAVGRKTQMDALIAFLQSLREPRAPTTASAEVLP